MTRTSDVLLLPCLRVACSVLFIFLALVCWSQPIWAQQPITYTSTKIADTTVNPGLASTFCAAINNLGTVAINLQGPTNGELWRGDGQQPIVQVAAPVNNLCPSINDLGETAYVTTDSTGHSFLVRKNGGTVTTLAQDPALNG